MTKVERDQLFQQLLVVTQGACHGTRPNYQEGLWHYENQLDEEQAQNLLFAFSDGQVNRLPDPREFLLLWGEETHIYALYNLNSRDYYLIRTVATRYHQWLLCNYRDRTPAEIAAANTVQQIYGVHRDFKSVAVLKNIMEAI